LSGFNRRQIVLQLWQKERADKFIWEKLTVGVFSSYHQIFQKPILSLTGLSTPALQSGRFIHAWHKVFLQSAEPQHPHLAL
jgi:hypothetical protein